MPAGRPRVYTPEEYRDHHLEKQRSCMEALRKARIAKRKCITCGNKPRAQFQQCLSCALKHSKDYKHWKERKNAKRAI